MPLSYSIATGIGLGFIAYVVLKAFAGGFREINAAVGVIAAFLLKLIFACAPAQGPCKTLLRSL
jgi:AGZA family xanthine/uracil permease-like MFS transporter